MINNGPKRKFLLKSHLFFLKKKNFGQKLNLILQESILLRCFRYQNLEVVNRDYYIRRIL